MCVMVREGTRNQVRERSDFMLIYVAHKYGGNKENINKIKTILADLQKNDLSNCYISPLTAFSFLEYKEIGYEEEIALCLDLLSVCDVLLIASEISQGVQRELEFARLVGMEVRML